MRRFRGVCVAALAFAAARPASAQQVADSLFTPAVTRPAYTQGAGPIILLDEAHDNFHTAGGRYLAFARLARRDGYVVRPGTSKFTRGGLDQAKILVIANAIGERNKAGNWSLPTPSAFDSTEIAAVRSWVTAGGSLLLIADHMPFPGAAGQLAEAFGILMANGFAMDPVTGSGLMKFRRSGGSLADHPITRGRGRSERIDSVSAFTGQAFRLDGPGAALLTIRTNTVLLMPPVAWQFSDSTPRFSAKGMLQGAVLEIGKGRVAVFGEAAMFSAQLAGANRNPMGMNDPAAPQNPQFLLNVLHWLSRLL